jgi:DNA-binding MarR family transcriptional regulator
MRTDISEFNETERKIIQEIVENEEITATQFEKRHGTSQSEVSRKLNKLQEEGLLEKKTGQDTRKKYFSLNKEAEEKLKDITEKLSTLEIIKDSRKVSRIPVNDHTYIVVFGVDTDITLEDINSEEYENFSELMDRLGTEIWSEKNAELWDDIEEIFKEEVEEIFKDVDQKILMNNRDRIIEVVSRAKYTDEGVELTMDKDYSLQLESLSEISDKLDIKPEGISKKQFTQLIGQIEEEVRKLKNFQMVIQQEIER